ncbi:MAG TPA: amidohydrolase family protein [Planctomycetaceae bacterium]|jgi:predicted TIM-barrel fold metal-dependent hydrolase|nr:amidohydrolase family protein [Planctomycetaceae bacterium]
MEIIDAYAHCGLSKYEPIEKVREVMAAGGVSRAVLVQHLGEFDNSYIGSVVASDPEHFAGVLLVDHTAKNFAETLAEWVASGCFQGLRLTAEALLTNPDLFALASDLGLAIVLYAPQGIRPILPQLERALESVPFTRLVITHLGNPTLFGSKLDEGADAVLELARFGNAYFQLSGMKMFCVHPHEVLYPLIERAVATFGPRRILWGSNYPVGGSREDYRADLRLLLEGGLPVPLEAIDQIAGDNAKRLWFDRN